MCAPCLSASNCTQGQYLEGICNPSLLVGPSCRNCDPTCETCIGPSSQQCRTCPPSRILSSDGRSCLTECPPHEYEGVGAAGAPQCQPCNAACGDECKGPLETDCLTCNTTAGEFLLKGQCVRDASGVGDAGVSYWIDDAAGVFRPCTTCSLGTFSSTPCGERQVCLDEG